MEKDISEQRKTTVVVLTGPESVGKSTLGKQLSSHFCAPILPEYARTYTEQLTREYTLQDVEHIAKYQIQAEEKALKNNPSILLLDTDLIITKVWFELVYGVVPNFVEDALQNTKNRFHLLLDTSPSWVADSVRENGGEKRDMLFRLYQKELEHYQIPYSIVTGMHQNRVENAITMLTKHLKR